MTEDHALATLACILAFPKPSLAKHGMCLGVGPSNLQKSSPSIVALPLLRPLRQWMFIHLLVPYILCVCVLCLSHFPRSLVIAYSRTDLHFQPTLPRQARRERDYEDRGLWSRPRKTDGDYNFSVAYSAAVLVIQS